ARIQFDVEPAKFSESRGLAENERARHPTQCPARERPKRVDDIADGITFLQLDRASTRKASAGFHLRRHVLKELNARMRVRVNEHEPLARGGLRSAIARAADLVHGF